MANPTLYKKIDNNTLNSKVTTIPTDDENTRIDTVINKFFELFKAKHMS